MAADAEIICFIRREAILSVRDSYSFQELTDWAEHVGLSQAHEAVRTADVWVSLNGELVTGWAQRQGNAIQRLYVAPDQMRQGAGTDLLNFVERRIGTEGNTHAVLDAGLNSVRFYAARGYAVVPEPRVGRVAPMRKDLRQLTHAAF
jgi:GNAT superfamily N-acetyltransferase